MKHLNNEKGLSKSAVRPRLEYAMKMLSATFNDPNIWFVVLYSLFYVFWKIQWRHA